MLDCLLLRTLRSIRFAYFTAPEQNVSCDHEIRNSNSKQLEYGDSNGEENHDDTASRNKGLIVNPARS